MVRFFVVIPLRYSIAISWFIIINHVIRTITWAYLATVTRPTMNVFSVRCRNSISAQQKFDIGSAESRSGARVVMSGTYGTLATTEQSGSHFQELSLRHRGEPSIGVPTIRSNDEFVSIEVRSSSHLRPVVNNEATHWACLSATSQRNQQSNTPSYE